MRTFSLSRLTYSAREARLVWQELPLVLPDESGNKQVQDKLAMVENNRVNPQPETTPQSAETPSQRAASKIARIQQNLATNPDAMNVLIERRDAVGQNQVNETDGFRHR